MKKTWAIMIFAIIAVSALSFAAVAEARPFMNWKTMPTAPGHFGNSNRPTQQNFVRLNGPIAEWGTTEVSGVLQTQSRTLIQNGTARQGISATAIWTTNESRPINALRIAQNFTYTFYTAKIVNASVSVLNNENNDLFVNGTWTVYEIETNFTVITNNEGNIVSFNRNQNAVALATNEYGELKITGNWTNFNLTINGIDPLTGSVRNQKITTRMFNPFKINDDNFDSVTQTEVSTLAKSYGAVPGWGNYNQIMDYNFNCKIDITDLATAAANMDQ